MSRESGDEVRGDGTIYNGFDYELQVWVVNGIVISHNHPLTGRLVADVPGHEVRNLLEGVTIGRCQGCGGGHVLRDGKCWNCERGADCNALGAHS